METAPVYVFKYSGGVFLTPVVVHHRRAGYTLPGEALRLSTTRGYVYYHMPYYDAAEKSTRCDTNTKFLDIEKTVYDSIPATAFTKHREIIPVFIASVVNVEITVSAFDGLQLRGWGQTASVVGAAFTLASFIYSIYCMFKEKNVKRRQDVINNSSFGADIPQLPIFHSSQVLAWVGYGGTEDYSASPSIWEAGPPLSGSLPVRLPRCGLGCEKEQL